MRINRKTIVILTMTFLLILGFSIKNAQGKGKGFLDLIRQIDNRESRDKIVGQTYMCGGNTDCVGYFTLIQFYEPDSLIFSYIIPSYTYYRSRRGSRGIRLPPNINDPNYTRRQCDGVFPDGTLIMMKVPKEMFEKARNQSSAIGETKIHQINWCKEFEAKWDIDIDTQVFLSDLYVVKDIIKMKKTDGSIIVVPVIEHYKFGATPEQLEWLRNIGIKWNEWRKNQ